MNKEIFNYLKLHCSAAPSVVDSLIVSSFVRFNGLQIENNTFLQGYLISSANVDSFEILEKFNDLIERTVEVFNFEHLIELFEFVISPADKTVNGAVYTPKYIRKFILKYAVEKVNRNIDSLLFCDLACGCGGFLLDVADYIFTETGKSFSLIFKENIYGLDITEYSVVRSKILLSLFAISCGEDDNFEFNINIGNTLNYDWKKKYSSIERNDGFDIIVGNPPYVASRNIDVETSTYLDKWSVTKSGHPDLYIPFFQIGLTNINSRGIVGYITVNTFIKSVNGRALRQYFSAEHTGLDIITFGGEQVFAERNTYTCICFLERQKNRVRYIKTTSSKLITFKTSSLQYFNYKDLADFDGWNLVNDLSTRAFVTEIENIGRQFKDLYETKNGIATLKNDVFKFVPTKEDHNYFYFLKNKIQYTVEKTICRPVINANKIKSEKDLETNSEQIIYPYYMSDGILKILDEKILETNYPYARQYLKEYKDVLAKRDKSNGKYEKWYAYGRRQSMGINAYKLFFPHICERPNFVICLDKDLLFYNGIAVISNNLEELKILKKILESDLFFKYIKNTTRDYASGYISMSKNYIKNFGIIDLTNEEREKLLMSGESDDLISDFYCRAIKLAQKVKIPKFLTS